MREFPLTIPLNQGLRPDFRSRRNSGFLTQCVNAKVNEFGLVQYEPFEIPFSQSTLNAVGIDGLAWPHPTLFKGKSKTILAADDRIFLVNENDWSLWELEDIYDARNTSNLISGLSPGNQWQFNDFWDTWMLHNGLVTVFHTGRHTVLGSTDKIYATSNIRVQAGCAHRGRSWFGGFDSDFFYSSTWKSFISGEQVLTGYSLENLGENFVFWTTIGGGDMTFLFHAFADARDSIISTANYDANDPYFYEYFRQNTGGSMPMPWQGKVRQMKPLGDVVMVYGDGGVSAISTGQYVGLVELDMLRNGISNTGAVGGNQDEHVFLDNAGYLWHIAKDLSITKLGYREFFDPMLGTDVVISYDPSQGGEFHICNGNKAYVLTKQGLTEHKQQITSIINTQGQSYCMGVDPEAIDKTFRLKTDLIDVGANELKTLTWLQALVEISELPGHQQLFGSTEFRYANDKGWQTSDEVQLNDEGVAHLFVTAKDFRLKLRCDDYQDINLDSLFMKYQIPDKRYTRGPRPTENR